MKVCSNHIASEDRYGSWAVGDVYNKDYSLPTNTAYNHVYQCAYISHLLTSWLNLLNVLYNESRATNLSVENEVPGCLVTLQVTHFSILRIFTKKRKKYRPYLHTATLQDFKSKTKKNPID